MTAAATRMIETDGFPIGFVSRIAARESWRKEIHRPVYHVHKWWANRLGSVFRGILAGCLTPAGGDFEGAFYGSGCGGGASVLDPFMGSGTTVGEAHKLGCAALGMDINPVACESVRVAMGPLRRERLLDALEHVRERAGNRIAPLYFCRDGDGRKAAALYYFWVMRAACTSCGAPNDVFSTYAFGRNAAPSSDPTVRVYCPGCGEVFSSARPGRTSCPGCGASFDPRRGPAAGREAACGECLRGFSVSESVGRSGAPPGHRMYAKLVLTEGGEKKYARATAEDEAAYGKCSATLKAEVSNGRVRLPAARLAGGHNTRQAMRYNYLEWKDFFNDRQLLALGWLHGAIAEIGDAEARDAMLLLFSGALEFNNMFASYKGEGTGAVRHMFSHHILKPERMPIEANVWGTEKSSGSFTGLFRSRLLRAADYKARPFEIRADGGSGKVFCSPPFAGRVGTTFAGGPPPAGGVRISCGSSEDTGLPDGSIDYVVTDPPFFDNVHYSELADFFHSWQVLHPRGFVRPADTTRDLREVQDTSPGEFAKKLGRVFRECRRVLDDQGLLVFTYHHSRPEGWESVAGAVHEAGFSLVNAHPIKSEMSVAAPKFQSRSPIQLDIAFVCEKRPGGDPTSRGAAKAAGAAAARARRKAAELRGAGLRLSGGDSMAIAYSQILVELGRPPLPGELELLGGPAAGAAPAARIRGARVRRGTHRAAA